MKRQLSVIFAAVLLILSLSACSSSEPEYGDFSLPGIDWGMTPEETFQSLGLSMADFELQDSETDRTYIGPATVFGEDVLLKLAYFDFLTEGENYHLFSASMNFSSVSTREGFDALWEKLRLEVEKQGVSLNEPQLTDEDGQVSWLLESTTLASDLPEEVREKYAEVYAYGVAFYKKKLGETGIRAPRDPLGTSQEALSSLRLVLRPDGSCSALLECSSHNINAYLRHHDMVKQENLAEFSSK